MTKELEAIKTSQSKPDNSIADTEIDLESKISRLSDKKEWINDMEARKWKSPHQKSRQKDKF